MGKKKFLELIKLASQPLPSKAGKSPRAGGYSGKQTKESYEKLQKMPKGKSS